ncbi:MAG: EAL domain-containing protein [Woeseiaceae bacterium]
MSDFGSRTVVPLEGVDLTQTIKKLSVPASNVIDELQDTSGTALLFSSNSDAAKWAPRWLNHHNVKTTVVADATDALTRVRSSSPEVIIVDAGMSSASGKPLYQEMIDAADLTMPIFVMCNSSKEAAVALECNPHDVIRKPFEWALISRRVKCAVIMGEVRAQFEEGQIALRKALAVADAARQRLRRGESFEPVTGLPNKKKFAELVERSMRAVHSTGNSLAVVVIGFNRFRLVVEAMGQERADMILTQLGTVLTDCMSELGPAAADSQRLRTAVVANIDHSRFAIMVTTSGRQDDLGHLQKLLLDRLACPIQIAGQTVSLSSCQGVAVYPHDADDVDSLLQRADNAMRDAQSRGGGFKYYCAETDAAAARKLKIEHMLHEALDRKELSLAYQPITEVSRGRVIAAEALLRWRQPDGSFIPPGEFVPIAEECGLMNRIGEFVLEQVCIQLNSWLAAGVRLPHMCVNVARVQLMSGEFVPTVKRVLSKHGIDPGAIELELSERGVLSGNFQVVEQLQELKTLGIRLSIDDFGTGDSAISYLRELPVDVLKIDRSYIAGLTDNDKDAALVSAMIALGQRLDLEIIAEGVETREQLAALKALNCDAFQGFLISRAVSGEAFASLLKKA